MFLRSINRSKQSLIQRVKLSYLSTSAAQEKPLLDKILIANRGEIACRVIRTARKMGIQTVAVYSDADRYAEHVKAADEAVHIGGAPATESYLRADKIIEACLATGAKAVHPGYGFLSENLDFCKQLTEAGIIFIGPPPNAIRAMGSKSESKEIMIKAGVPVTPGYHGDDNSKEKLLAEAKKIGFPLMIKAVAGGGGKGMRAVFEESQFLDALESCQREAIKSFKDGQVLLEKLLQAPKHVEFQVFGDMHGNAVHLMERDCSVQRRHQKVLEEAPAPGLDPEMRRKMGEAAVACVKATGYVGAGTVEFLIDTVTKDFYFCEMNTRLQVEHPVTEMITGTDLVAWQLLVASGRPLPLTQEQIFAQVKGYAIEARIYAENPLRNFLPASGTLYHLRTPAEIPGGEDGVRVDSGVIQGNAVSTFYDPMIAKLICYGPNREETLKKLERSLRNYQVAGLPNNIDFVLKIVQHEGFAKEVTTTAFFTHHMNQLLQSLRPAALKTLPSTLLPGIIAYIQAQQPSDISALWSGAASMENWRSTGRAVRRSIKVQQPAEAEKVDDAVETVDIFVEANDKKEITVQALSPANKKSKEQTAVSSAKCTIVGMERLHGPTSYGTHIAEAFQTSIQVHDSSKQTQAQVRATVSIVKTVTTGDAVVDIWVVGALEEASTHYQLHVQGDEKVYASGSVHGGSENPLVLSPMPGKVVKLLAKNGDLVKKGQPLLILEAMKMEHAVNAPISGNVSFFCTDGVTVAEGSKLVEVLAESK